jgi:aspartate ammonia-lyase
MATRIEKDSMGTMEVPEEAYYGVQTARAIQNFPISGQKAHAEFIRAVALIKVAAAKTNLQLGYLCFSSRCRYIVSYECE